jgi:hypothetical protein
MLPRPRLSAVLVLLCLGAGGISAAPALALTGLTTGITEMPTATTTSGATWIGRAVSEQAGIVRISVGWVGTAPSPRPAGFNPANPTSPGYSFSSLDAQIEKFSQAGLEVLLTLNTAPSWAEGPHMPRSATPGSWRPNATQFGLFAKAVATRYDGHFPDPKNPLQMLPRVSYWQGWNEPNLSYYLSPQWVKDGKSYVPASPGIYRGLENAFYKGVKSVSTSNYVVMAGTAPYGDAPGGQRMQPVAFYRSLFCLQGRVALRPTACQPTYFDAVDHHPYGIGGPLQAAFNPDDVSVPDIHKIARVLAAAERDGRALPRGHKAIWATEFGWNSKPPSPTGVPLQRQARWLEQGMYVLWEQGVDTVLWLLIVDQPQVPLADASFQASGLYTISGQAKPAATAFRFPFITTRLSSAAVRAWGRSPATGQLQIEVRHGSVWRTLKRLQVSARQIFETTVPGTGALTYRAQIDGQTSLTWAQSK